MDTPNFNLISLCAGSGQLDIGVCAAFRRHGINARVLAYGEREAAPCAALRSRMEDSALEPAPIWGGNLEDFPCGPFRGVVDGIVAGFPCQPHSVAGGQKGRDDERNLLPAILRTADATGAGFLFLENVAGLKREFDYICATLLQSGWNAQWGTLRVSDVGGSHRRERWFCVAWRAMADRKISRWIKSEAQDDSSTRGGRSRGGPVCESGELLADRQGGGRGELRQSPGRSRFAHRRNSELGNAKGNHEWRDSIAGSDRQRLEAGRSGGDVANDHDSGRERKGPAEPERRERDALTVGGSRELGDSSRELHHGTRNTRKGWRGEFADAGFPVFAPGPADPAWIDILTRWPFLAPALPDMALRAVGRRMDAGTAMEAQSSVRERPDGMAAILGAARADMLRIIGNGVCPQQAECAFAQLIARAWNVPCT